MNPSHIMPISDSNDKILYDFLRESKCLGEMYFIF